eukprot:TRINITY_DN6643_c0_g1_i1.p1 TRINITY_DN6643_c0_g1~~TRINITY_DN6643_c0_g1_i1.p1  ORF type:complete len:218 (+),score=52.80 TRINITY_DN6643_c0_g1_i1:695-1348(+)
MAASSSKRWSGTQTIVEAFKNRSINQIIFPYHLPNHWTLLVINQNGTYYMLDSLGQSHDEIVALKSWLEKNFSDRRWTFRVPFVSPHQKDQIHCGAFAILYATKLAQGKTIAQLKSECAPKSVNIGNFRAEILAEMQHELDRRPDVLRRSFPSNGDLRGSLSVSSSPAGSSPSSPPGSVDQDKTFSPVHSSVPFIGLDVTDLSADDNEVLESAMATT